MNRHSVQVHLYRIALSSLCAHVQRPDTWAHARVSVCVAWASLSTSSHLSLTWTRLEFPAVCQAMWRTHAGAVCSAELQTGARHGMKPACFSCLLSLLLSRALSLSSTNAFAVPASPSLPATLSTSCPVFLSLPRRAQLRHSLGLWAKAQAVPCRDHMDSGVLRSRERKIVPTQRV